MSPGSPKKQASRQGRGTASRPRTNDRAMRTLTQAMLVGANVIVAITMVGSLAAFVLRPDPAVKAGPMYVTLTLTTVAAVLMALLAVSATFFPVFTRQQRANLSLVMWTMGATGLVTGLLTLGGAVSSIVMRMMVGSLAYIFISVQRSRIERAHATAPAGQAPASAPRVQPSLKSRQRRGGRKN
jgi:hypothetical protein